MPGGAARQWDVVLAVSAGGVFGAESRYGLGELVPHTTREFPSSTLIINVTGCLLIGALMVLLLELTAPHRLARPFLGVGVLGGYTTFSTFAGDTARLVDHGRPLVALAYVVVTTVACLLAVYLATIVTRQANRVLVNRRLRHRAQRSPR